MKPSIYSVYSILAILVITIFCFIVEPYIGYQSVGLLLMLNILIASFSGKIKAVLLSGGLSALVWNFFFITPRYYFSITSAQDKIMILTYFLVSLIMALIASRMHNHKLVMDSERLYRAMFDSVSHELKTPLTALIGSASAIAMNNLSPESQIILVNEIVESGERLNNVINNLLDMSRIRSGTLKPKQEVIEVNTFLNEFIDRNTPLLQNCEIIFTAHANEVYILGDEGLLENIFFNVLKNSNKHAGISSVIDIQILAKDSNVEIVLTDNGVGVHDKDIKNIFDPFFSSQKSEGLGLGLSIAKAFTEAMNGKIKANNLPGKSGFMVCVQFPLFDLKKTGIPYDNK